MALQSHEQSRQFVVCARYRKDNISLKLFSALASPRLFFTEAGTLGNRLVSVYLSMSAIIPYVH